MNRLNKALLAAAVGSGLLALEACRKGDTNRLAGRWRYMEGDFFLRPNESIIFDFAKDGDFTEERVTQINYYGGGFGYTYTRENGDWKWATGKKLKIDREFTYDIEFKVILIHGNDMELKDEGMRDWIFRRE